MDDLLRALEPLAADFPTRREVVEVARGDRRRRRRGGRGRGAAAGPADPDRGRRPAERRQVDAGQRHPRRGAAVDRAGGGDHPRRDRGQRRLVGHAGPHLRHRRDAEEGQGPGEAGEAVGLGRRCGRSSSPRWWCVLLDVQMPFESQDLRIADLAEREGRAVVIAVNKWDLEAEKPQKLNELREAFGAAAAAAARGADGDGVGDDRQGARPAARGDRQGVFRLEHKDFDGAAQPLAAAADGRASAAGAGGAADPAALHDPGQDPAADVRDLRLAPRRGARGLQALPGQWRCGATSTCRARRSGSICAPARTPTPAGASRTSPPLDKHKPRRLEG